MADQQAQPNRQLVLQKIYIKDMSFESPKAPDVFRQNSQAQTQLNIRTGNNPVDDQHVEVTLTLTVESKDKDETLFLVELVQAGVFMLQGYSAEERSMLLGSFCPGTLYPFAREAIADIATKGGFPQLLLQPINFDALYAQAQQERAQRAAAGGEAAADAPPAEPAAPSQGNGGTH
jgi:preprotein translocase subunit SecB